MISFQNIGRIALGLTLVASLASCAPTKSRPYSPNAQQSTASPAELRAIREAIQNQDCRAINPDNISKQYTGIDVYRALSDIPIEEVHSFYANKTHVSYDLGRHGTQIEYTTADGEAHLWYPGNSRILHGRWKAQRDGDQTKICFAYGDGTYNPQTGHSGGDFECGSFHSSRMTVVDLVDGDVFALARTDDVSKRLEKEAVKPFVPNCLPVKIPHLTDGKSPAQHLLAIYPPQPTR
ncbi:MAG: hypothetical protein KF895_09550 [Parvibaculum sp.]|nr:hypothetical protein [Parvibaculum sp.]